MGDDADAHRLECSGDGLADRAVEEERQARVVLGVDRHWGSFASQRGLRGASGRLFPGHGSFDLGSPQ